MRLLYYLLENISLTSADRNAFFSLNEQEGVSNNSPYPNQRNHWQYRLDDNAVIYEGDFPDTNPGRMISLMSQVIGGQKRFLPEIGNQYGDAFELQIRDGAWGTVCRMIIFGGVSATWEESHTAVLQYLADNNIEWDGDLL